MSWSDTKRFGRIGLLLTAALGLGGCLQPLHSGRNEGPVIASTAPGGPVTVSAGPAAELAAVDILPIDGRVGQQIRNDLIFFLTGGGQPAPPRYRLDIDVQVISAQAAIVDPFTSRPQLQTAGIDASYVLIEINKGVPLLSGNAIGRATYTRNRQRFASTRAQRDAEDRAAKVVAEQIRAKLMTHFSGLGGPAPVVVKPAGT